MRLLLAAVVCLGLLLPTATSADIYRYTDEQGVVHFTNVEPRSRGWKRIVKTRKKQARKGRSSSRTRPARRQRWQQLQPVIEEAALRYQLPPSFIRAVMQVESNFQPDVVSVDGAIGLMQLMPGTAAGMGVRDPYDPRENVLGGARYLRVLANMFNGDLVLTVAAYNAGHGAVAKYDGVPPYPETRRYVQNVLRLYYRYRAQESADTTLASAR